MDFITSWLSETWAVVEASAPYLLLGFFLAGLIRTFVPIGWVARHLGGGGSGSILKASLLGVPLPLCSCSVIPVAASLRRQGASRGATASFLISTPETGVDSISISYALLGPFFAVARPVAAFVTAWLAGTVVERFAKEPAASTASEPKPTTGACPHCRPAEPAPTADHRDTADHPADRDRSAGVGARLKSALHYGYVQMFRDLGHWLVLGFILAGLISALVPAGFWERYLGPGPLAYGLVLLVALPLYVCATGTTPVAAALLAAGLSPGAALVFLLVGPATNATTMMVIIQLLGRRALGLYVFSIAVVAILFGLATDALLGATAWTPTAAHMHETLPGLTGPAALVLTTLLLTGLAHHLRRGRLVPTPATR